MSKEAKGSCLCQAVQYTITDNLGLFQYCHCSRCRKFSGSAFASNLLVAPEHFTWTQGEEYVQRYELPGARHFATCFCSRCGSSLPWLAQSGKAVVVPAGTLDSAVDIRPSQNLFCDSDADWYTAAESLPQYAEMPPRNER